MPTQRKRKLKKQRNRLGKRALQLAFASSLILSLPGCAATDNATTTSAASEESNYQLVCKVNYSDDGHSKTYYDYDDAGRTIREIERNKDGELSNITKTEYDDQGRTSLRIMEDYESDDNPSSTRTEYYADREITGSSTVYYRKGQIYQVDKSEHWEDEND